MSNISSVTSYWYENGNTGYMNFELTIRFCDDRSVVHLFKTGKSTCGDYTHVLLCNIKEFIGGELNERSTERLDQLIASPDWKDIVESHDVEELDNMFADYEQKSREFNIWMRDNG